MGQHGVLLQNISSGYRRVRFTHRAGFDKIAILFEAARVGNSVLPSLLLCCRRYDLGAVNTDCFGQLL